MEKMILLSIGVAAVYFVVRRLWKETKGEVQCSCSQGGCGVRKQTKKSCSKN